MSLGSVFWFWNRKRDLGLGVVGVDFGSRLLELVWVWVEFL